MPSDQISVTDVEYSKRWRVSRREQFLDTEVPIRAGRRRAVPGTVEKVPGPEACTRQLMTYGFISSSTTRTLSPTDSSVGSFGP